MLFGMNKCEFCDEECYGPHHSKCFGDWERENGRPEVVGVICSQETNLEKMSEAIKEAIKLAPRYYRLVVKV